METDSTPLHYVCTEYRVRTRRYITLWSMGADLATTSRWARRRMACAKGKTQCRGPPPRDPRETRLARRTAKRRAGDAPLMASPSLVARCHSHWLCGDACRGRRAWLMRSIDACWRATARLQSPARDAIANPHAHATPPLPPLVSLRFVLARDAELGRALDFRLPVLRLSSGSSSSPLSPPEPAVPISGAVLFKPPLPSSLLLSSPFPALGPLFCSSSSSSSSSSSVLVLSDLLPFPSFRLASWYTLHRHTSK